MEQHHRYRWGRNAGSAIAGHLPAKDIRLLMQDAFDRNQDLQPLVTFTKNITAKNAYDWTNAFQAPAAKDGTAEKIQLKPLLGHSSNAVKLSKGAILRYRFVSSSIGDARFTLATIPSYLPVREEYAGKREHRRCRAGNLPDEGGLQLQGMEDESLARTGAQEAFYVTLLDGYHTVEIKALDDRSSFKRPSGVLDFDVDRILRIPGYEIKGNTRINKRHESDTQTTRKRHARGLIDGKLEA